MDRAKHWTLRCSLENQRHRSSVFTTLTYDDEHLPPTLSKRHIQLFIKRLRKKSDRPFRHFTAGEYGEQNQRPHYHSILFGLEAVEHGDVIERTWGKGFCKTVAVTPAAIAYVAGYAAKKIGFKMERGERVDPDTGEVYEWEPPFIMMSSGGLTRDKEGNKIRHQGIGGWAKQHPESWRDYGIHNGNKVPVPRYLHQAWKDQATPEEIARREYERQERKMKGEPEGITKEQLQAAELLAAAKQRLQADRRKL